jgi:dienelactone hydrolase
MIKMNRLLVLLCIMLLGLTSSCSGAGAQHKNKPVEQSESCTSNPQNTYEVYVPSCAKDSKEMALLVIIDAHGSGKFALQKFKTTANQYCAVAVASNLVRNGFAGFQNAIQELISDARKKYPVGKTVFIAGFSGGARMALEYASLHPANGLLLCGALANAGQIKALNCPVFSISGMDDFNFIETAQYLFDNQYIPQNLKIELTNNSHSWPDSSMLANAFGFLYLNNKSIDDSNYSEIEAYTQQQTSRLTQFEHDGDYIKAALIARNMSSVKAFDDKQFFDSAYQQIKGNNLYINSLDKVKKCLVYESGVRQHYMNALVEHDSLWWANELKTINIQIQSAPDAYTRDMYFRIKGFWGIVCYSIANQSIAQQNFELLNKILPVYRTLEPENPDAYYFTAIAFYRQGSNSATITWLKKAKQLGFVDMGRLKNDFPEVIWSKL